MATWQGSSDWGPEGFSTIHGPARSVILTMAETRRALQVMDEARKFRMPTFNEEMRGIAMKLDQVTRAATVSHGAWL